MKIIALVVLGCLAASFAVRMGPLEDGGSAQIAVIVAIWFGGTAYLLARHFSPNRR